MSEYTLYDIIGPIMIGPSSSHTAGAARIGNMARDIAGEEIKSVLFYLHGSFAKTYKGHGTDKALVAGVLGFKPDDERIRDSFKHAKELGLNFEFTAVDLGEVHPNTVRVSLTTVSDVKWSIIGSSIGGGKAKIIKINDMKVEFDGEYNTLITSHDDCPGVVANVTRILSENQINIAFMKLFRSEKAQDGRLIIETDDEISETVLKAIERTVHIRSVKLLKPI